MCLRFATNLIVKAVYSVLGTKMQRLAMWGC